MTVSLVIRYKIDKNKQPSECIDKLINMFMTVGYTVCGTFSVTIDNFQSFTRKDTFITEIFHSALSNSVCAVVENDTGMHNPILMNSNFDKFLKTKLNQCFEALPRSSSFVQGSTLYRDDFTVRIGTVIIGKTCKVRGILLELQYDCGTSLSECFDLLSEICSEFCEGNIDYPIEKPCLINMSQYKPEHTFMQYHNQIQHLRKSLES
ncbi:Protein trf-proximal [Intoshia linei]|uniref:Mediator of RNA polymerase II transcription subunit 20 n=1 Tax=Intoshia linei TaxID=1819745 RepID=A0A177B1X5_9BILA|nr:Protein trf-proximal [Intoshia linei]